MPDDHLFADGRVLRPAPFALEADFERAVVQHAAHLFGDRTLYFDVKRRIGPAKLQTVPDGFLLDFTFADAPRLYFVEHELASHDAFRHIGQQLLKFAVSHRESARQVRSLLLREILGDDAHRSFAEAQVERSGRRNLDDLIDAVVHTDELSAVIVIDRITPELNHVLRHLAIKVDVLEFAAYTDGEHTAYRFTPFHDDLDTPAEVPASRALSPDEYDTIIVPAHEDGFEETFLGEQQWHAIRISAAILDRVKYCAVYRVKPTSAVTHVAPVDRIVPYGDSGKYAIHFREPAVAISPVRMAPGEGNLAPQAPRYTSFERLQAARTLGDLFA